MTRVCAVSRRAEVRSRLSCGSLLLQTSQVQPRTGTPLEVPVPRKVKVPPASSEEEEKPPLSPPERREGLTDCIPIEDCCLSKRYVVFEIKAAVTVILPSP
jgi:hypothetical protein